MTAIVRLATALAALLLGGCAALQDTPGPELRQALAPTGKLRVGLLQGVAVHAVKDSATGEWKGVSHDLGREFAARLGVAFEPVFYSAVPAFLDGGPKGEWDVAFIGLSEERARVYDYAGRHLDLELGYLVPPGSRIAGMAEVDRAGVRVAVVAGGSPDRIISAQLRNATVLREQGIARTLQLVKDGKADVFGSTKGSIHGVMAQLPGSRILEGRPGSEEQALALAKGRGDAAVAFARRFIEDAKASGQVKAAVERAGLRGAAVAP